MSRYLYIGRSQAYTVPRPLYPTQPYFGSITPNFPLPSSTQTSITNAPASRLLIGVVRTLPNPRPPPPSLFSSPPLLSRCSRSRCASRCIDGSATIHGCTLPTETPIGGSAESRSSIAIVNVLSAGRGAKVGRMTEKWERVARNWFGRFSEGGGGWGWGRVAVLIVRLVGRGSVLACRKNGVRCSEAGICGNEAVEKV